MLVWSLIFQYSFDFMFLWLKMSLFRKYGGKDCGAKFLEVEDQSSEIFGKISGQIAKEMLIFYVQNEAHKSRNFPEIK